MELAEERHFNFSTSVVISLVALQNLVHVLEEKGPEAVKWTKISHELADMGCVVVIGPQDIWSV